MDDIASRAGISKRTLYEEFADKEELVELAVRSYFGRLAQQNDKIARESPNILVAFIEVAYHILSCAESSWRLHNTLKRFNRVMYDRIFASEAEFHHEFVDALNDGVKDGYFSPRTNMELAVRMLYIIGASIVHEDQRVALPEGITPRKAFLELSINFMRGISTQKGLEIIDKHLESRKNSENI